MKTDILIGIPCTGSIVAKTTFSLVQTVLHTEAPLDIVLKIGCNLVGNRNWIVNEARRRNCTHLFFVDSDMFFPPDTLTRLLASEKAIIGVAANRRKLPKETTVKFDTPQALPEQLFTCRAVGTGIMLIQMKVFEKIERPWFLQEYNYDGVPKTGEDVWFCQQARKAGYDIWCDPTIKVGHIGEFIY